MGRDFKDLSNPDRIQAVLAVTLEPIPTKGLVFDLAGVDKRGLTRDERIQIRTVLTEFETRSGGGAMQYEVPVDRKQGVIEELGVEIDSVNGQMADVMLGIWNEMSTRGIERR